MAHSSKADQAKTYGDLILFDGQCVYCSKFAHFIARHDRQNRFKFVTAHSATGRALFQAHGLDPDRMETNIIIVDNVTYTKFPAFAAAMRAIGWPWRIFAIVNLVPKAILEPLYDFIARNRYRLGRQACPLPSPALKARLIE